MLAPLALPVLLGLLAWPQAGTPAQAPQQPTPPAPPAPPATLELTVEQALDIALGNDLGLQIEALTTETARYRYEGSWGAFDPVVTAQASYTDAEFETQRSQAITGASVFEQDTQALGANLAFPLTTGGSFNFDFNTTIDEDNDALALVNPKTTDNVTLSFNQPLLRGAWSEFATSDQREAEILWAKQVERYRQTRHTLLLAVQDAYWDLAAAFEELRVAEDNLALGKEQLSQNERRLQFGVGTEVEVLQAEATVAQREEILLLAEVNVRGSNDRLKAMLYPGTDPVTWNAEIRPTTPLPDPEGALIPAWEQSMVVALELRPELRQQRLEIDAAEVRLSRSLSLRLPGLALNLSSSSRGFDGNSAEALEESFSWDFPTHRAEIVFDVPIGNTTARNEVHVARAGIRTARLVYDQVESQVVAEVRDAVRQLEYQGEAVRAAQKSLELAQRQLEAEQARYREGLSTNFQVLEFQQDLAAAQFSEVRARANLAKARAALERAVGRIGEQP
jgi:outer membrane protein TolC